MKHDYAELDRDVISRGLCARCGMCAGVCPVEAISFTDRSYPELTGECTGCGLCVRVCPGADVDFESISQRLFNESYEPSDVLGRQERMVVGHPTDDSIRKEGASGGLTTALLVHLLNTGRIQGAAVVGMDEEFAYKPKAVLATTEKQIRNASKSKYCIVPSMSVLSEIRKREGTFAVVALPCQVHGLRKLETADPALAKKIGYIFGLYCHYNMEKEGYLDSLKAVGIDVGEISGFEFRGNGWPGGFTAVMKNGVKKSLHDINIKNVMTIMLRLYGAERCCLCTDGLAEFADLALGDFWAIDYEDYLGDLSWCTLVSERTPRGREVLESAKRAGAVKLYELSPPRYSRRTVNFAKEKKREGFVKLRRRAARGRPAPDYHYGIPAVSMSDRLVEAMYGSTRLFRAPWLRRWMLKILYSRLGRVLDRLNSFRKDITLRFGGN
ncbi:MAG: Coenzyme F420 hydrogenase/dehydrogenase, beta subunit C-terminal domain [Kiritimatiellia bacterium]